MRFQFHFEVRTPVLVENEGGVDADAWKVNQTKLFVNYELVKGFGPKDQ